MGVTVLCVQPDSNYFKLEGLNLYDKERDAYNYNGNDIVITHAPCQQWSRMKNFAKANESERLLAYHCFALVNKNGGIFEHPAGSSFFSAVGADMSKIISVNQSWWGFPAQKRTYLYFNKVKPLSYPLSFDAIKSKVELMSKSERSKMPLLFCTWLVDCCLSYQNS